MQSQYGSLSWNANTYLCILKQFDTYIFSFYQRLSKIPANERIRYTCNVFFNWLIPYSAMDWNVLTETSMMTICCKSTMYPTGIRCCGWELGIWSTAATRIRGVVESSLLAAYSDKETALCGLEVRLVYFLIENIYTKLCRRTQIQSTDLKQFNENDHRAQYL